MIRPDIKQIYYILAQNIYFSFCYKQFVKSSEPTNKTTCYRTTCNCRGIRQILNLTNRRTLSDNMENKIIRYLLVKVTENINYLNYHILVYYYFIFYVIETLSLDKLLAVKRAKTEFFELK